MNTPGRIAEAAFQSFERFYTPASSQGGPDLARAATELEALCTQAVDFFDNPDELQVLLSAISLDIDGHMNAAKPIVRKLASAMRAERDARKALESAKPPESCGVCLQLSTELTNATNQMSDIANQRDEYRTQLDEAQRGLNKAKAHIAGLEKELALWAKEGAGPRTSLKALQTEMSDDKYALQVAEVLVVGGDSAGFGERFNGERWFQVDGPLVHKECDEECDEYHVRYVRYQCSDQNWYSGEVVEKQSDGTYLVIGDDGEEHELWPEQIDDSMEDLEAQELEKAASRFGFAAAVYEDKLYVLGGSAVEPSKTRGDDGLYRYPPGNHLSSVACFDGQAWSAGPAMPNARFGCAAAVYEGALYVLGGANGNGASPPRDHYSSALPELNNVEVFDGQTWKTGISMRITRMNSAAAVYDGALYVLGGTAKAWECLGFYPNPSGRVAPPPPPSSGLRRGWWSSQKQPDSPVPLCWHRNNGSHYGANGQESTPKIETAYSSVERFDGSKWSQVADMIQARAGCAAVVYNGSLYVLGGRAGRGVFVDKGPYSYGQFVRDDWAALSSVERLVHGAGSTWSKAPSMISARYGCAGVVAHGFLYVFGGHDGKQTLSSVERFDGSQWSEVQGMIDKRQLCAAVVL